jgi:hypothetical protein
MKQSGMTHCQHNTGRDATQQNMLHQGLQPQNPSSPTQSYMWHWVNRADPTPLHIACKPSESHAVVVFGSAVSQVKTRHNRDHTQQKLSSLVAHGTTDAQNNR